MIKLTQEQCLDCVKNGEFNKEILTSAKNVAIVLTQSWCPQWIRMRSFLETMSDSEESNIYFLEYDRESFFRNFMRFKEDVFGNDQVPYLRYYHGGVFGGSGNYASRGEFLSRFGLE